MPSAADASSSNVRLRGAGIWLMTVWVTGSMRNTAPQSGQLTSNPIALGALDFAMEEVYASSTEPSDAEDAMTRAVLLRIRNQHRRQIDRALRQQLHARYQALLRVPAWKQG